jgi:hypothetical protein
MVLQRRDSVPNGQCIERQFRYKCRKDLGTSITFISYGWMVSKMAVFSFEANIFYLSRPLSSLTFTGTGLVCPSGQFFLEQTPSIIAVRSLISLVL